MAEAPLLLALFLAPCIAGNFLAQDSLPSLLLGALVWLALALRAGLSRPGPLPFPRLLALPLALVLLSAISLAWSANRGATLLQTALYATLLVTLWLSWDLVRRGGAWKLVAALLAGAVVVGVMAVQEYVRTARSGDVGWRAFATFTNPNFLAGYLVPALLLALPLVFRRPEAMKATIWWTVVGLTAVVLTAGLMVTGSRGGLLSLGAGLLAFFGLAAVRGAFRDRSALLRLGGLLLALALTGVALSTTLRGRAVDPVTAKLPPELCPAARGDVTADSNNFRRVTWQASLNMGRVRPLTGWGSGSFETAFAPHEIAAFTRHAHSGYLQLWAELGAPGVLLWLGTLLLGAVGALRTPRTEDRFWVPGAGAALAATSLHNFLDSIVFVPAAALLTWTLLGLLLPTGESPGVARRPSPARPVTLAAAALGLAACLLMAVGCSFLAQGQAAAEWTPSQALESLKTAQALLPWDHRVAVAQGMAYARLGQAPESIAAGKRAIELAPHRPPGYFALGKRYEMLREDTLALGYYKIGLEHGTKEIELWFAKAELLNRLGQRQEALADYRRIAELEDSPVGQIRALEDIREWRYARARLALAADADTRGRAEEALEHRKKAACLLAERRLLFEATPWTYLQVGDRTLDVEPPLRDDEQQLWQRLAEDYRRRGDTRLASLCDEQSAAVDKSRAFLEELRKELGDGA